MTIKECIDIVDNLKPNQYSPKEKVMWLSFIDEIIINDVLKTHEGYDGKYDNFAGYSEDKLSVQLIVASPYDRLYTAYLKMKIDGENGETARYNNSASLFNSYLMEFRKHYNKTHMPLDMTSKKPMPKQCNSASISDAMFESLKRELYYLLSEDFAEMTSRDKLYDIVTSYAINNVQMLKGKDGRDGIDGKDGVDGKDGKDGRDGVDGKDGKDGVDATSSMITTDGTIVSPNADFAEVAEWADGNPNNEDRTGYFVCANVPVEGIVMKKATSIDDVKGVSILAPAFAGNYSKDKVDSNGNLLPKYSYVAIIGFVPVRDNGTCTVGGRCMPDDNGCAIPSSNSMGYQVVNRIDENRVLIIIEPNGDMVQRVKTKINQLQETVAELKDEIDGNIGIPEYWKSALENGAQAINERLCEAGSNKSAFLFYSDAHWSDSSKMSPTLLKYLYKHTGMTKTFFGGDVIGYGSKGEETDYDTMSYLWDWRNQVKDLPNHHSVVGNHDDGQETNNLFSEHYVYGYLRAAEETNDIVRGSEGLYYYIDNIPEKTRYLFLDTAYRGATASQLDFIKQALLTTPNGWHIVAVSHIWYDADYSVSPPIISDLNNNASQILELFDNYNSRNGEYAECKGKVEFCVGGHTHRDYDGTSATGIPIILVETDSSKVRSGLNYELGKTTEASVNGIIADYHKHKIYVVRIGRGESREITINYPITNVLPLAVDVNGTPYCAKDANDNIISKGWKADTKYSASSNADANVAGTYVTGYISVKPNDVVYLQGITMPNNDASKDAGKLFFFTALGEKAKVYSGQVVSSWEGTVRDKSGNLIQFTVPSSPAFSYVRIQGGVTSEQTAPAMSEDSIITINEPIEKTEVDNG